ncbi:hypothetical protein DFH08DRAFT_907283, partial [Mycena albidolilacea]
FFYTTAAVRGGLLQYDDVGVHDVRLIRRKYSLRVLSFVANILPSVQSRQHRIHYQTNELERVGFNHDHVENSTERGQSSTPYSIDDKCREHRVSASFPAQGVYDDSARRLYCTDSQCGCKKGLKTIWCIEREAAELYPKVMFGYLTPARECVW